MVRSLAGVVDGLEGCSGSGATSRARHETLVRCRTVSKFRCNARIRYHRPGAAF